MWSLVHFYVRFNVGCCAFQCIFLFGQQNSTKADVDGGGGLLPCAKKYENACYMCFLCAVFENYGAKKCMFDAPKNAPLLILAVQHTGVNRPHIKERQSFCCALMRIAQVRTVPKH